MDGTDRRHAGLWAIRRAAAAHGLPTDLIIISDRWNTVVRLGDTHVIAKSAPLSDLARQDSARWYQQEIDVCRHLAARGAPVQSPYADSVYVDAASGIPVSLWHLVPGEMGGAIEQQLVDSLAHIHQLGSGITLEQPWFSTITTHFPDVFQAYRERNLMDAATIARMGDHYSQLLDRLMRFDLRQGFIHGDAQRKNAISSGDRAIWIDFEECSIGPVAWDLACLARRAEYDTDRVLDRYAETSGTDRILTEAIDVLQELRDLEAMTWMIAIQDARDEEFRRATADMLAEWRVSVG